MRGNLLFQSMLQRWDIKYSIGYIQFLDISMFVMIDIWQRFLSIF